MAVACKVQYLYPGTDAEGPMRNFGSAMKQVLVTVGFTLAFLLAIWLPLVAYVHYVGSKEWKDLASSWVSGEERRHLMRYHGTDVLKITQERVYIWRESRWVSVQKRTWGRTASEITDRSHHAVSASFPEDDEIRSHQGIL